MKAILRGAVLLIVACLVLPGSVGGANGMSVADFLAAGEGDPVELDPVVITAVFPDVIYASTSQRLPAIAILGGAGLSEGNRIRLQGTKTMFGDIPAVNASPATPIVEGEEDPEPYGVTNAGCLAEAHCPALGSLVRVCGEVGAIGADWFTVGSVNKWVTVFGDVGTPPLPEARVMVVGICSVSSGENGSLCGIRVRRATDIDVVIAPTYQYGITIRDAFCRGGQVFLHWTDPHTPYTHYHVYRSGSPIQNGSDLAAAEAIDLNCPLNGAKDRTATYTANAQGYPDPNTGLRIADLGQTLDPSDGLKVVSIKEPGSHYYCVVGVRPDGTEDTNVIVGRNSSSIPVVETVGPPSPVLDTQIIAANGYPVKVYNWFRRDDETLHDGDPTKVVITHPSNTGSVYRTMLFLHCLRGTANMSPSSQWVTISPVDYTPGLPKYGNSWWYGYGNHYPDLTTGSVVNYTEVMLMHMLDWAKANFPVDPNRVFVEGGSMGGTGGISFGMRHPELFAGIDVQVPQVNPRLLTAGLRDHLWVLWGYYPTPNLPADEGLGAWDRMDMVRYVTEHTEDLPYLKVQNGRSDNILPWPQIPDFYRALNSSRHGFIAGWGPGGHTNSSLNLPAVYTSFSIFNAVRLNQSYVAVSNSSANNNPGNGDPLDGDVSGQMGGGLTWSIVSDTAAGWTADLTNSLGQPFIADVSARRLQDFRFAQGAALSYSLTDLTTSAVLASGSVNAERENFFVIPQLPFGLNPARLAVGLPQ